MSNTSMERKKEKALKVKWLDECCGYCGNQLNSWDIRVGNALMFNGELICEECIADEYGMTKEYLRDTMLRRFGMHPCEGL